MKITENLTSVVKALKNERVASIQELATELKRTTNSVRSTVSVPNYKKYFVIDNTNVVNDKIVKLYSLSSEGKELLQTLETTQKENN